MPEPSLEMDGASIVLMGAFNPPIFQPEWFARQGLLPATEAEQAKIQIVHQEVAQFETERFVFQVTHDRLLAATKPNSFSEPLRDLVAGTFYILEHTPVNAIGLNRDMHFNMHSEESWHRLGDMLAPKNIWNKIAIGGRPGLKTLQILYGATSEHEPTTTVTIQPSVRVLPCGAYFGVNQHFTLPAEKGFEMMMQILQERWEEGQKDAERVARTVLDWAKSQA